ncbi:MAG: MFS transporter [Chloroflexota bacterium]|nr:MFS transporter [Chloroflexota bacterium]
MVPNRLPLASVAGVFVDRWDRKWTLVACDLARAVAVLLLLFVSSEDQLWLLYVAVLIQAVIYLFFDPAKNALIPLLAGEGNLKAANSLSTMNWELGRLVGRVATALLVGLAGVVLTGSASFLLSGALTTLIFLPRHAERSASPHAERAGAGKTWLGVWREWLEGLRLVRQVRAIGAIFLIMGAATVAQGIFEVLFVAFVEV